MKWGLAQIKRGAFWARVGGSVLIVFAVFLLRQHELWGNETRVLFFGSWLLVSGLLARLSHFRKNIKYFLVSSLGGFMLGFGFPPYPLLPLMIFGFIPLFWLEKARYNQAISGRAFVFFVFNFFLIWNLWTTFWIANTAFFPGIVGMGINAILMTAVVMWINWIHRKTNVDWYFALVFIAGWLTFEFVHLRWDLSWPWLNLGNALASWPVVAQWYEYTGVLGGTVWILVLNFLFFQLINRYGLNWKIFVKRSTLLWVLCLIIPVIVSVAVYFFTSVSGPELKAVVINPNIEPHYQKFEQSPEDQWKIYSQYLEEALESDPELVMLPETIFERINVDNIGLNPFIGRINKMLKEHHSNARVLLGITSFRIFDNDHVPHRSSMRTNTGRDGHVYHWEVYNSAILLGNDTIPIYHKQKLVPGAENFPYRKLLFFLNPIIDQLGGTIYGYGRITSQDIFSFGKVRLAPVICYESVYGEYMRKYVAKGANVLAVITNDGWWGRTEGHVQHYEFAALRAIEYRRSVLRSANLGSSGAFDERGDAIVQPNNYDIPAVIPVTATLNSSITFYALWGDYLGRFSIFLMVFFTLKSLVNTILRKS